MTRERYEEIIRLPFPEKSRTIDALTPEERKAFVRCAFDKCVEKNGEALRRLSEN